MISDDRRRTAVAAGFWSAVFAVICLLAVRGRSTTDKTEQGFAPYTSSVTSSPVDRPRAVWNRRPSGPVILDAPGIRTPDTVPANQADLDAETPVFGVVVDGVARAYVIEALNAPNHIINDVVNGKARSIVYCDLLDCVRVFAGPDSKPLELQIGGWNGESLMLKYGETRYEHLSPDVPLRDAKYERTTWGHWMDQHPRSDVCTGRPQAG